jgi:hypothetical protein
LKVNNSRATRPMKVTPDGRNLVSHAGTALLSELADRSGLTEAMSLAMSECGISWHTHDPGVVLTHLAVAIADGADCLADMAALREQDELFGQVASIATAWRAVEATAATQLRAIPDAVAAARAAVWAATPPGDSLVLDFDATLQNCHSEKQDAAESVKRFETPSYDAFGMTSSAGSGSLIQAMVGRLGGSGLRWRNLAGFSA